MHTLLPFLKSPSQPNRARAFSVSVDLAGAATANSTTERNPANRSARAADLDSRLVGLPWRG